MGLCAIITCDHKEPQLEDGQHICGEHQRHIPKKWKRVMSSARKAGNHALCDKIYARMVRFVTERMAGIA